MLRRMGERGDIIKTLHREMAAKDIARSPADYTIHDPADPHTKPVTGRVMGRGLSDGVNDRHYLIVDGVDGRARYIDIGKGEATEPLPDGSIVRVTPKSLDPRKVDRTVTEVAAANGGRYNIDIHLRHDPRATESFAETHIRRLEAIRRATGKIDREPNGTWIITPDHLDKVTEYERGRAKAAPVIVEKLSHLTLDQQLGSDGATWLDRELIADTFEPTRDSGFGREVKEAQSRRRRWLISEGLARQEQGKTIYLADMQATLRRRELTPENSPNSSVSPMPRPATANPSKVLCAVPSASPAANMPSLRNPASSHSSPGFPSSTVTSANMSSASCAEIVSPGPSGGRKAWGFREIGRLPLSLLEGHPARDTRPRPAPHC